MTVGDGGQPPVQGNPGFPPATWPPPTPYDWQHPPSDWQPDTSWQQGPEHPTTARTQYGWAPPPKPGLVPLRPLSLGTILGGAFRVLRRNPKPMVGTTLLLYGALTLLFVLLLSGVFVWGFQRITNASSGDRDAIVAGTLGVGALTLLLPLVASVVVQSIVEGLVSLEVARGTLGEKLTTRALFRTAPGRLGPLVGWAFALTGAILVGLLLTVAAVAALISYGGTVGLVLGILLAIGAALGSLVCTLWLGTKLSLVPSALLVERLTLGRAIARSWRLTRGVPTFWRVLGIELLVGAIVSAATNIVTQPLSFIGSIIAGVADPTGDSETTAYIAGATILVAYALSLLVTAVGTVVQSATSALLYIDLRMRREGLDLHLIRYVEARQSGDSSVDDPYRASELHRA